jgi:hypothetical protein
MSVKGFYASQEGHVVQLIPPQSLSSTNTSKKFSMANWRHASILIMLGATTTLPVITLNASDNGSPETLTPIPFNLHKCETAYDAANGDVLGVRTAVAAAGFTPVGTDNIFYVIELDADTLPQGSPYVELVLTSPTSVLCSAAAVLSGGRYAQESSDSVVV